jgi:hypothetical protein
MKNEKLNPSVNIYIGQPQIVDSLPQGLPLGRKLSQFFGRDKPQRGRENYRKGKFSLGNFQRPKVWLNIYNT